MVVKYKTVDDILALVPTRKLHGEVVPRAPFKEIIRLLKTYRYTPKELDLFAQEIKQLKVDLKIWVKSEEAGQ